MKCTEDLKNNKGTCKCSATNNWVEDKFWYSYTFLYLYFLNCGFINDIQLSTFHKINKLLYNHL